MLRIIRLSVVLMLSTLLGLVSCGGGGGDTQANGSGVGSGGTGSYTNGPVSGLGSIIVNNVRYDVNGAQVHRDDDADDSVVHDPAEVKVGMVVEVNGSGILPSSSGSGPAVATAYTVRYGSSLVGPVSAVDSSASTVTVLGQTVRISAQTVQPVSLGVNDVVEVYGLANGSGVYEATRIDKLDASTDTYKIVALVNSVDSQALHLGLNGNVAVSYAAVGLPGGVTPGARVRVWFDATPVNGQWSASRIRLDQPLVTDRDEASLEGLITRLPQNGVMLVDGSPVDVSRLSSLPSLMLGERVRVEGRLQAGVLLATELEDPSVLESEETELYGAVSQLSSQAQTFVVRGVTVAYTPSVVEGTLADNACVEVHGKNYNSSGQLIATEVSVHSSCN